ncbi:phosphotransferase [Nocardia sp. NPDC060259]|uniref:phosphotransferase n=1 Tax=Nocardia sp. NPDC060259 TaxID=3347088 RepID=UPI00364A4F9B
MSETDEIETDAVLAQADLTALATWMDAHRLGSGPLLPVEPTTDVARWLDEHRPISFSPGVMHGDYHAANVMCSRGATRGRSRASRR